MSDNGEEGFAGGPEDDVPMSFFEHLAELRRRLMRSAIALVISFVICYALVDQLTLIITAPFVEAWEATGMEGKAELQNLAALDAFLTDLRIAVFAALFVAAPVIFYQAWMFIAPGLYAQEKKMVIPFVATSVVMFTGGAVFCYYTVLPIATEFFLEYPLQKSTGEDIQLVAKYTYADYTTYTTKLLLGFGLMFEFPLAVFFLAKAGVVTHQSLLRYWKLSIIVICVASAFLTPPDPITLGLMAAPMVILFFASVGVAFIVGKEQREAMARLDAELAAEEQAEAAQAAKAAKPGAGVSDDRE